MGYGLPAYLSLIAFIAMVLVSGLPVVIFIAPDGRRAFKLMFLIDGAEFLVLVCFSWFCRWWLLAIGGFSAFDSLKQPESLILAQDERWRQA